MIPRHQVDLSEEIYAKKMMPTKPSSTTVLRMLMTMMEMARSVSHEENGEQ